MSHLREYAIAAYFSKFFAAYFAITWSACFEKNVRVFLTCLNEAV